MARLRIDRWLLTLVAGRKCAACATTTVEPVCAPCLADVRSTAGAADAAYRDIGAISRLVRRAKAGDWRTGGAVLAELVVGDRPECVPRCDAVTWIPADPTRRARRGGHLPERFARRLARL